MKAKCKELNHFTDEIFNLAKGGAEWANADTSFVGIVDVVGGILVKKST